MFVIGAESNHNINSPLPNDPEGILNDVISSMTHGGAQQRARERAIAPSRIARACPQTIAKHGWTRHDVRCYLQMYATNKFGAIVHDHQYGKAYNRHLPRWYRRDLDSRHPDRAVARQHPPVRDRRHGRPLLVLHPRLGPHDNAGAALDRRRTPNAGPVCIDGTCYL